MNERNSESRLPTSNPRSIRPQPSPTKSRQHYVEELARWAGVHWSVSSMHDTAENAIRVAADLKEEVERLTKENRELTAVVSQEVKHNCELASALEERGADETTERHTLECKLCGVTKQAPVVDGRISLNPFTGWTFTTETDWLCPRCSAPKASCSHDWEDGWCAMCGKKFGTK